MAEVKRGVSDNAYQHLQEADTNGDGYVSSQELAMYLEFKRKELEDQDAQRDAMRKMTWFALWGMLLYPVTIVIASWLDVDDAATIIGNIAPTYFVAISALVAAFFGANAYSSSKKSETPNFVQPPMPARPGCRIDCVIDLASFVVKKAPFAPSPVMSASGGYSQFFPTFLSGGFFATT